jgi:hypothetical protein
VRRGPHKTMICHQDPSPGHSRTMYDVGNIYSEFRASLKPKSVGGSDTVAENSM